MIIYRTSHNIQSKKSSPYNTRKRLSIRKSTEKKSKQLGINYGTASNRLKKMLFFSLVQKLELNYCLRCGEKIENYKELSIDHIEPWLNKSNDLFWDIDNIAYSHLSCNSAKQATSISNHPSYVAYSMGCRCDACKMCKKMYIKYNKWRKDYENS